MRGDAELARFAGCETVTGDLDITAVTDLESLGHLRSVEGTLAIHRTERAEGFALTSHARMVTAP